MKNIYIKLKLLAAKHRSFAMGTFVLIVFVAMIAVFSVLDNRYALSMITNASSIGNNSHQIAYGEDDANTVTVTATIQEDSNKPTAEIENGVKAEFEYQHDGQTVTVEGTVSVEKKDSGDNGGNGDNTNPTTGDNGGNGDNTNPTTGDNGGNGDNTNPTTGDNGGNGDNTNPTTGDNGGNEGCEIRFLYHQL